VCPLSWIDAAIADLAPRFRAKNDVDDRRAACGSRLDPIAGRGSGLMRRQR